jgi:hypothetical protein
MSRLTRLTTLKLKRTPLQDPHPEWLGALTQLKHLLWDPYRPVDVAGTVPAALAQLTGLETLYMDVRLPYVLPTTLTNLNMLLLTGRLESKVRTACCMGSKDGYC